MSNTRTFPRGDHEFFAATGIFYNYVNKNQSKFDKFSASRIATLETLRNAFQTSLQNKELKDVEAQSATAQKNADRQAAEDEFNDAVRDLRNDKSVSAADLEAMGLDVPDTTPTATAAPTTRPLATVDTSQRLEHRIEFVDETSPATGRRAKPDGVRAGQIWEKIGGAPPVDIEECEFVAEDSGSPYLRVHKGTDAGKTVYYILRWISTRGETGPLSETVAATITG